MRSSFLSLVFLFAIVAHISQLALGQPVRGARRPVTKLGRLNRILEKRQKHEHDANESYKYLRDMNYRVWPTNIIAGHFRQVRKLASESPYDNVLIETRIAEESRMDDFVEDANELNALTNNRLYGRLGLVKNSTWDDLIGFILNEIDRCRRE